MLQGLLRLRPNLLELDQRFRALVSAELITNHEHEADLVPRSLRYAEASLKQGGTILDNPIFINGAVTKKQTLKRLLQGLLRRSPYGNRTRVTRMKIWCPNP